MANHDSNNSPHQVMVNGDDVDESDAWNFNLAEEDQSIASLVDESVLEDMSSIPSIVKERDEQMSVSTTDDEFEDETTIGTGASEKQDDYDMTDFYDMDCGDVSLTDASASGAQDLNYNVTDITCPLCRFIVDGGEAIVLPGCNDAVCLSCMQDHIKSMRTCIDSMPICCPLGSSVQCSRPLGCSLVQQINDMELTSEETAALEARPSAYHSCPSYGCTNVLYWKEGNGPPIGDCFQCNRTCCLKCGISPFHNSKTCQEYQASLSDPNRIADPLHVIEERGERNSRRCSL